MAGSGSSSPWSVMGSADEDAEASQAAPVNTTSGFVASPARQQPALLPVLQHRNKNGKLGSTKGTDTLRAGRGN